MKITRYREFSSFVPQPGVRLCAKENDRYKTVRARIALLEPIQEGVATQNALLAKVLNHGSVNHPSRRELARACEELYGATLSVTVSRLGDVQLLTGAVEFPADRYLPEGSKELEGALGLLAEVLTQPAVSDKDSSALRAQTIEQELYQLENELNALQDDKPSWAARLATERIYAGTPGAVYERGALKDLKGIDGITLFNRHRLLLGNARVMAFVTGPVQEQRALKVLAEKLTLPRHRRPAPPLPVVLPSRKKVIQAKVPADTEQAHLIFAWTGAGLYGKPDFAPSLVANGIFGGFSMSRLFKVVREKHGLAYAVHSVLHRSRGLVYAQAAVAPENANKAMRLVRTEMKRLQTEGFTDEEFEATRASLIEGQRSQLDSLTARAVDLMFQSVLGFKMSPEKQLRELANVRPAEVRRILKRLKPHTEFRMG
jgi:predicted Zn-dependent peptidase